MYAPEGYRAVCYRCSFESNDSTEQRCPVCQFAFILEPETTPADGRSLEDVLHRSSVRANAPLLPGVHADKREAQIREERRRDQRLVRKAQGSRLLPLPPPRPLTRPRGGTSLAGAGRARPRVRAAFVALLGASVVAAGVAMAALGVHLPLL
jgi:hypothetical protein